MSYCVNINGLEHLPNEQTLLIHYDILCTGEWYLAQLLTAYRNVCDTEWTVMYPNHQHPRHTDFPILVNDPPLSATFAWNYGGIQGIESSDFDNQHSYLVQLSLFEYGCLNTGETPNTGNNPNTGSTGTSGTGATTGNGGGGPGLPGGGGGGGGTNPAHPGGGSGRGTPPVFSQGTLPGASGTGTGVADTGTGSTIPDDIDPRYHQVFTGYNPTNPSQSGNPLDPSYPDQSNPNSDLGNQEPGLPGGSDQTLYDVKVWNYVRPSNNNSGDTQNPNINFQDIYSPANPGQEPVTPGEAYPDSNPDLDNIGDHPDGQIPGLSATQMSFDAYGDQTTNTYNINQVMPGSVIDIQVNKEEITQGEPIVISAFFQPSVAIDCYGILLASDDRNTYTVSATANISASPTTPLTCGGSINSNLLNLGNVVLTYIVRDLNNEVIGIKSVSTVVTSINNSGPVINNIPTLGSSLPDPIIYGSDNPISSSGNYIDLYNNNAVYVYVESTASQQEISTLLTTNNTTKNRYTITAYTPDESGSLTFTSGELSGSYITIPDVGFSDKKYQLENNEVYGHIHDVALTATLPSSKMVLLEVAPLAGSSNLNSDGYLYLSDNFNIRAVTSSCVPSSVTASVPLAMQKYGLVVNGRNPNNVPTTVYESTSDLSGNITFVGFTLTNRDYYSIVASRRGIINPYYNVVHQGRYTS